MATQVGEAVIKLTFDGKDIKASLKNVESEVEKSGNKAGKSWADAWTVAAGNLISKGIGAISNSIANNLGKAINRVDTIKNFPKVMTALGYSTDEAKTSIDKISGSLDGLPTSMDAAVGDIQKLASTMGNLADGTVNATSVGLALNNMFLAGGKGTEAASRAMEQYNQILASGKADMQSWRSMLDAAPGQLKQLAQELLGTSATQEDLRQALNDGTISFDQMNEAIVKLNEQGGDGFASFEEQARSATGGIGTAIENVQNRIAKAIAKIIDRLDSEKIAGIINEISSHFSDLADVVIGAIDFIAEHWNVIGPIIATLGTVAGIITGINLALKAYQKVQTAVNAVQKVFSKTLGGISSGISKVTDVFNKSPIGGTASKIGEIFQKLANVIKTAVENIGQILNSLVNAIMEPLKTALKGFGEALAGFFKAMADPAILLGAAMFAAAAASIAAAIYLIGTAVGAVMPTLTALFDNIIKPIAEFIADTFINLIETFTEAIVNLTQGALIPLGEFLVNSFIAIINGVADAISSLTQGALVPLIDALSGAFTNVLNAVANILTGVIKAALEGVANIVRAVGEGFEHMGNAIKTALEGVQGVLQVFADLIKSIAAAAVAMVALVTGHSINYGGGYAHLFAEGGRVEGPGTSTSDSIPAMLSDGEYVIQASAAKQIGYDTLDKLNEGHYDWSNSLYSDVYGHFSEPSNSGKIINVYMTNKIDNVLDADNIGQVMMESIRRAA